MAESELVQYTIDGFRKCAQKRSDTEKLYKGANHQARRVRTWRLKTNNCVGTNSDPAIRGLIDMF